MTTIGIVGGGVVGRATAQAYRTMYDVRVYDIDPKRATHILSEVLEQDIIFVCLPTPAKNTALGLDLSAVDGFFGSLGIKDHNQGSHSRERNFVLKSTVPIGTTRRLREQYGLTNLVHSPEFLTARTASTDAQMPSVNIVGYPAQSGHGLAGITPLTDKLLRLYSHRFPGVQILRMSSDESEAVKLFLNGFFAVKVSYFNEIRSLADKLSLEWDAVFAGMLADGRVSHSHTMVPGPDGKRGFGGTCLPKDLAQLVQHLIDNRDECLAGISLSHAARCRNLWVDRKGKQQ